MTSMQIDARRASKFSLLLGSASLLALCAGNAHAAAAVAAAAAPVEEITITGSLIQGAPAVGVPVTALGDEDFTETGSLTITDLLANLPQIGALQESSPSQGGGRLSGVNNVDIHGQAGGAGNEALLLVDGLRIPPQNYSLDALDPSIIPRIMVQRIDVLSAGASATYGADATSGVFNVILRRGYDGAITEATGRMSPEIGRGSYSFAQLYGRTWASGGITIGAEWLEAQSQQAHERDYYTTNFEPYGFYDHTPLGASTPGVVSLGTPSASGNDPDGAGPASAARGTRYCNNCFAVPKGVGWDYGDTAAHTNPVLPGSAPTTTWTAIQAGKFIVGQANTQNQDNIWKYADIRPHEQSAQFAMTFDQDLVDDAFGLGPVALFVDGFFSNRRSSLIWMAEGGDARDALIFNATVPTHNPYYPTGAPANLRVSFNLAGQIPQVVRGHEHAGRYNFGLNFDELPYGWNGKFVYSMTEVESMGLTWQPVSVPMVRAALGQTVPAVAPTGTKGGFQAFSKPAGVPFLNPFCDSDVYTCNSPITLDYITGFRDQRSVYKISETELTLNGPIFDLPAGPISAALGFETTGFRFNYAEVQNFRQPAGNTDIQRASSYSKERTWSVMTEVAVPIFGDDFSFPLAERVDLSLGYRYDYYEQLKTDVHTPKIQGNWLVGWGLALRGAYGKSFRSPNPAEQNGPLFTSSVGINQLAGQANNTFLFNCPDIVTGAPTMTANPGTLQAAINPTCSSAPALLAPGGVSVGGGGQGSATILRTYVDPSYNGLQPVKSRQWYVGFNFAPTEGFLQGFNLDVQYFDLHYTDILNGGVPGEGVNDPRSFYKYTVAPRPDLPNTAPENAAFLDLLLRLAAVPTRGGEIYDQNFINNIKWITDSATANSGESVLQGIDFSFRWDYDIGNYGTVNIGAAGYYELDDKQKDDEFSPMISSYASGHDGNRLKQVRYRLGWTDMEGIWTVNTFARYRGHGTINNNGNNSMPLCFYSPAINPNTGVPYKAGDCYPGSPFYGPYAPFPNFTPATVEIDLAVSYDTGDRYMNPYLQNIRTTVSITNLLDKEPPFQLGLRGSARDGRAFDNAFSDQERVISISIAKTW
jgi:outer membrane receptor protein involved in Fe transport